jgi:hypothetical protein
MVLIEMQYKHYRDNIQAVQKLHVCSTKSISASSKLLHECYIRHCKRRWLYHLNICLDQYSFCHFQSVHSIFDNVRASPACLCFGAIRHLLDHTCKPPQCWIAAFCYRSWHQKSAKVSYILDVQMEILTPYLDLRYHEGLFVIRILAFVLCNFLSDGSVDSVPTAAELHGKLV